MHYKIRLNLKVYALPYHSHNYSYCNSAALAIKEIYYFNIPMKIMDLKIPTMHFSRAP